MKKQYGLSYRVMRLLIASAAVGLALFFALNLGCGRLLEYYFDETNFSQKSVERHIAELQTYIHENDISLTNADKLVYWCKKQPLLLVEIYRNDILLFTSAYAEVDSVQENDLTAPRYSWASYYDVDFSDGSADVVMYSDEEYTYYYGATIVEIILSVLVFLLLFTRGIHRIVDYVCKLSDEIQILEGGELDCPVTVQGNDELSTLARSIDDMRKSFQAQLASEAEAYAANQTLITGLSHDLRTPLTKLMIYTEILRYGKYQNAAQMQGYLEKVDDKAQQIKQLADHIFNYSRSASTGQTTIDAPKTFRALFYDPLSELAAYLSANGILCEPQLDWELGSIAANAEYIERLLDNVASNLLKYADRTQPVTIRTERNDEEITLVFQNMVSPDKAPDGTQVGVRNMCAMMEQMHGLCRVTNDGNAYQVELHFPLAP